MLFYYSFLQNTFSSLSLSLSLSLSTANGVLTIPHICNLLNEQHRMSMFKQSLSLCSCYWNTPILYHCALRRPRGGKDVYLPYKKIMYSWVQKYVRLHPPKKQWNLSHYSTPHTLTKYINKRLVRPGVCGNDNEREWKHTQM